MGYHFLHAFEPVRRFLDFVQYNSSEVKTFCSYKLPQHYKVTTQKKICPRTISCTLLNQYAVFWISSNTTALRLKPFVPSSYHNTIRSPHKKNMPPYHFLHA